MTDDKAKVVQSYEYDSYGNRKDMQNSIKQPYTYTGREFDRETGLYNYRARYYDAGIGGFISKDQIGFAGGEVNLYNYVGGNPVNYVDPSGLLRSTPEAALINAVIQGNVVEAQTIAAATGIVLTGEIISKMQSGSSSDAEKLIEDIIKKRNEEIANSKGIVLVEPPGGNDLARQERTRG